MRKLVIIIMVLFLCPSVIFGQDLPALEVSKEIVRGSLPNGIEYYLVNNSLQKGFADYAIVQREDLDNDRDKKALTYLPHFGFRKPYRLMSESGVGFHQDGFVTKLPDATYFYFKDVPTYKSAVADSTLLMVMDVAAVSRKPQAIIISGDIDIAKIRERMSLLSIMAGKLESSWESTYYQWNTRDSLVLITNPNRSKNIATIEAIYRSTRQGNKEMNTALPLVIRSYSNILERIVKERLSKSFIENNIPLVDFDFVYSDSSQGPFDEFFSFKLYTSADCLVKATQLLSSELSAIDKLGATIDEIELASIYDTPNSTIKQFERHITNEEYIAKCVASYLYGANLAPEAAVNNLINNRNLAAAQKQTLFNNYAAALLDPNKNLTLRVTSPNEVNKDTLKKAFLQAWNSPSEISLAHGIPREIKLSKRTKLKEEAAEPISGGQIWTFANGIKVVFKNIPTKGEISYSLISNSGLNIFPKLEYGEAPYVDKLFSVSRIAGTSSKDFLDKLAKDGISINRYISTANMELKGSAPSTKLETVLSALLSITNDSYIDEQLFAKTQDSYSLTEDLSSFKARNANDVMVKALLPSYPYSQLTDSQAIGDDFCKRAEQFFKAAYSRINDGVLVLLGDLEADETKKILAKYLGEFSTDSKPGQRVVIKDNYFKGIASLEDESVEGAIGGSEISANIALTAPLAYSAANQVAFQAALKIIKKELASIIVDNGAYFEVKGEMSLFPSERMTVYINAHPCNANGLPLGIVSSTSDEIMETLLNFVTNMDSLELPSEDIKACIALINSEFSAIKDNPSTILENVKLRYSNGKDMVSSKTSAINNLNETQLRNILSALSSGTRIEYIIR